MPIYRLRCSYGFTDGRHGVAFGEHAIEAANDEEAVAKAEDAHDAPPNSTPAVKAAVVLPMGCQAAIGLG